MSDSTLLSAAKKIREAFEHDRFFVLSKDGTGIRSEIGFLLVERTFDEMDTDEVAEALACKEDYSNAEYARLLPALIYRYLTDFDSPLLRLRIFHVGTWGDAPRAQMKRDLYTQYDPPKRQVLADGFLAVAEELLEIDGFGAEMFFVYYEILLD